MKKTVYVLVITLLVSILMLNCQSDINNPEYQNSEISSMSKKNCVVIKDGVLEYSAGHYLAGQPLMMGYDPFGYNYQAHMFNGSYANAYLGRDGYPPYDGDDDAYLAANPSAESHWTWPYRGVRIMMKWNDAWLANSDCDGDGVLDRHYGFASYIGSGAWLTNHSSDEGFVKIIAAPADAVLVSGVWIAADGSIIGPVIWGAFAIIQEVDNGLLFKGDRPGLGNW